MEIDRVVSDADFASFKIPGLLEGITNIGHEECYMTGIFAPCNSVVDCRFLLVAASLFEFNMSSGQFITLDLVTRLPIVEVLDVTQCMN
ncbi:MAG: hypothetical protein M0019_02810 [Actinomycetota bacterium]|nr:hypothetical protein [Actinomycetota bacterium]